MKCHSWLILLLTAMPAGSLAAPLCPEAAWSGAIGLPDGRVLALGLTSACVYDPRPKVWTRTGPLETPRRGGRLTVLADGRVLLVGGAADETGEKPASQAEIFTPTTGRWEAAGELASAPMQGHTAVALADGRAWVNGEEAAVFDPVFRVWYRTRWNEDARRGPEFRDRQTVTRLQGQRVLVAGGDASAHLGPTDIVHTMVVTPSARTETVEIPPPVPQEVHAHDAANGAAGTSLLETTLVDDGHPVMARWRPGPPLRERRSGHAATLLSDGSVLLTGGLTLAGSEAAPVSLPTQRPRLSRSAERWLPAQNRSELMAPMSAARHGHAAILTTGGRVMVMGGFTERDRRARERRDGKWAQIEEATASRSVEEYDPTTDRWRTLCPLQQGHSYPSLVLLPEGGILVAGLGKIPEIYAAPSSKVSLDRCPGSVAAGH